MFYVENSQTTYTSYVDMKQSKKESCQVILFGYNRPDLLKDRLNELIEIKPSNLLVSIDWFSVELIEEFTSMLEAYSNIWPANCKFNYKLHDSNQGLARHLTETITRAFNEVSAVIVIEDDVSVSGDFVHNATEILLDNSFIQEFSSIGGYSIVRIPKFLEKFNFFRNSIYFQCWGWGTRSDVWDLYRLDLQGIDIETNLSTSDSWNNLSRVQRQTWLGRFEKIQHKPIHTWDIQFQYLTFLMDKKQILPAGRLTENLGFGDKRGVHNKNLRPWWLGRSIHNNMPVKKHLKNDWIDAFFQRIESISLIGDSQKIIPLIKALIKIIKGPARLASLASRR